MARARIFTPDVERSIARRIAAGESTRSIAKDLGTSPQNVQNSARRSKAEGIKSDGEPSSALDEFEAKQLDTLAAIEAKLTDERVGAVGLAALVKAQNDTIKAIRQHRILSKAAGDDPDANDMIADQVRTRLERLAARSPAVPTALEPVEETTDEQDNGTEG